MHIKTRLDLIMEALQASREAQEHVSLDCEEDGYMGDKTISPETLDRVKRALEKIERAYDAAHGTEERPGT